MIRELRLTISAITILRACSYYDMLIIQIKYIHIHQGKTAVSCHLITKQINSLWSCSHDACEVTVP